MAFIGSHVFHIEKKYTKSINQISRCIYLYVCNELKTQKKYTLPFYIHIM